MFTRQLKMQKSIVTKIDKMTHTSELLHIYEYLKFQILFSEYTVSDDCVFMKPMVTFVCFIELFHVIG